MSQMSPLGLLKISRTCLARELYMNCLLFDWFERCATPVFDSWLLPCHSSDHVWSKDILSHQTHFWCYCIEIVDTSMFSTYSKPIFTRFKIVYYQMIFAPAIYNFIYHYCEKSKSVLLNVSIYKELTLTLRIHIEVLVM